jgi:hypothetical protein
MYCIADVKSRYLHRKGADETGVSSAPLGLAILLRTVKL